MLAPPKRVGFYPNGAFLRYPHLLLLLHFSTYIVSVCTAGRSGLNLSCTKIERSALPLPWYFAETESGTVQGKKYAGRLGTFAQPPGVSTLLFLGRRPLPPQSLTKGPTPHFALLEVYGYHPPRRRVTQALTGADTCFCVFGLRSSIQIGGH